MSSMTPEEKTRQTIDEKLIDISSYPVVQVLDLLLQDKTTKKNIIRENAESEGANATEIYTDEFNAFIRERTNQ
jgi:hypothetical protein